MKQASVFIVDGKCWSGGGSGTRPCQGTKETIEQCKRCLRYLPVTKEKVMDENNVQEDFEVTKQAMKAYEAKLKGEIGMVTKEEVEKAYNAAAGAAEWVATYAGNGDDADDVAVGKAYNAAWFKYLKLKEEYENGN